VLIMFFLPFLAVALAVPPKRSTSGLGMFIAIVFVVAIHKLFQYGERTSAIGLGSPWLTIWVPFVVVSIGIMWMYWTLAHKPGGQPIGALERVFAKAGKAVGRLLPFGRRDTLAPAE
jgi:lipopolysaccharide export system permease protein